MEETQLEQTKQKTETLSSENAIHKLLEEAPNITKAVDWYHYGKKKGQERRFELNEESQNAIATLSEKLANASLKELLEAYTEIKQVAHELNNSETEHILLLQKKAVLRSIRGVVETRLRYKVLDSLKDKPEEKASLFEEIEELKAKRKSGDKRVSTIDAYVRYAEKIAKSDKKEKINTDLVKRIKNHLGRYALIILTVLGVGTIAPRAPNSIINQPQTAQARIEVQKQASENMPELLKDNLIDLLTKQNNQPQNEPSDIQIKPEALDQAQQVSQESSINENDIRSTNLRHTPDSSINEDEYSKEPEEIKVEKNEEVKLDEFDLKQTGRISKEKIIEILNAYNADYENKESLANFFLEMEKKYGIGAEYVILLAIQETRLGNDIATGKANLAGKNNWFNYGRRNKNGKFPNCESVTKNIETVFWQLARYRNEWGIGKRPPHIPENLWREVKTFQEALEIFAPRFENPNLDARIENGIKFIQNVRDIKPSSQTENMQPQNNTTSSGEIEINKMR